MKICPYETTCIERTDTCQESTMPELHAKPIIENKFWIVEQDGQKIATLRKNEDNHFVISNADGAKVYSDLASITKTFGKDFFVRNPTKPVSSSTHDEVYGYSTSVTPHNAMFDIKRKLPLFTKSEDSKSLYCAGYYVIKFDKGWVKSYCPKLITLQRYSYQGPFKTEFEMKQVLSNVSK